MLDIQMLTVGQLQTNCYLVSDTQSKETLIIDPGDDGSFIGDTILSGHLKPIAVLATHGHFDHVFSAFELMHIFHIPFYLHPNDEFLLERMKKTAEYYLKIPIVEPPPVPSKTLQKKTSISVGLSRFVIWQTPGHTPGGVSFICEKERIAFTGDTVFEDGAIGDFHHAYSDKEVLFLSVGKILTLAKETILYPGHGGQTTVNRERLAYSRKV